MDSNHRSSGCRPDVFATGPRDREVAEIGVEPTKSPASGHRREERWSWPLFQFAYSAVKWQVQGSHLAGEGYEPSLGAGPPASKFVSVAGPGIEPRRPAL